jgi:hypothetical protein
MKILVHGTFSDNPELEIRALRFFSHPPTRRLSASADLDLTLCFYNKYLCSAPWQKGERFNADGREALHL